MIDTHERHLACPHKSFGPFFTNKEIVKNQILGFDQLLCEVDLVVIMVKRSQLIENREKQKGKVVLDSCNVISAEMIGAKIYHI